MIVFPAAHAVTDGPAAASSGSKGGGSKKGSKSGASKALKLVTRTDLKRDLTGCTLKLLWPDDNTWWDGQVCWGAVRLSC